MYSTTDFKKGLYIELDGVPFEIVEFQHVKPGKGNAFVRTRLKNLLINTVIDKTFKSGETVGEADLEKKRMQYLYKDGAGYQCLDLESFEQLLLEKDVVAEKINYFIENLEIDVLVFDGRPISVDLPNFVNLAVEYTEPALKGDTVSGGGKPARMETGLNVTVPFHIKQGDVLKIDTRSGSYVEKVK